MSTEEPTATEPLAGRASARLPAAFEWLEHAPFFQAGLQGYSDSSMRIIARRHGAPFCVTEALLAETLLRGGKGLRPAELDGEDHPVAGQLMGSRPADMAAAARLLVTMGYDVIDVNLACPVKKLRHEPRGGHLLAEPEDAVAILSAVREAVPDAVPVTVKLRRGFDDSVASLDAFHRILEAAIGLGLWSATVHGRTVEQKYVGASRWCFLADLTRRYPGFRIFGSGDIFDAGAVRSMLEATGVEAVSVARGAIGNPWIFRQSAEVLRGETARAPTLDEQRSVLEEHCELAVRFLGESGASRSMRKFGIKFSRHHPRAEEVAMAFVACRDLADWRRVLATFFGARSLVAVAEFSSDASLDEGSDPSVALSKPRDSTESRDAPETLRWLCGVTAGGSGAVRAAEARALPQALPSLTPTGRAT